MVKNVWHLEVDDQFKISFQFKKFTSSFSMRSELEINCPNLKFPVLKIQLKREILKFHIEINNEKKKNNFLTALN
ncbi:hypothetical protein BpHYR1_041020 [Brachionus plicatilis]|uniref:Uncharacterized protein n=1 Tax=Brachionus plicatilis TaxID=10195 RepID=A0A3M7R2H8_BRAPC|nr:hypothetical protein BpHYR1_041020 [Brachionus plicatilis]